VLVWRLLTHYLGLVLGFLVTALGTGPRRGKDGPAER